MKQFLYFLMFLLGLSSLSSLFPTLSYARLPTCSEEGGVCRSRCQTNETVDYNTSCPAVRNRCCFPTAPQVCTNNAPYTCPGSTTYCNGIDCTEFGYKYICDRCVAYTKKKDPEAVGSVTYYSSPLDLCTTSSGTSPTCDGRRDFPSCGPNDHLSCGTTPYCTTNVVSCTTGLPPGGAGGGGAPPPPPRYNISGTVFIDDGRSGTIARDGKQELPEPYFQGVTVTLSGAAKATATTNSSGNFAFNGYLAGNYKVTVTVPAGYVNTSPVQKTVTLGPNATGINFGMVNIYSITGNVFNDLNKNRIKDTNNGILEPNVTSGITITTTGGNLSINSAAGTYSITNLFAGTYKVSYTSAIPAGYFLIYPLNGPPPQHSVTVGPNCNQTVNLSFGSTCNNGNIQNANFAISNSVPWMQSYGFNMRLDEGFEDKIPTNPIYPPYASVSDQINAF